MESTDIVDQRKHMRFQVKEGAFAVLMNHVTRVGPIKDISRDENRSTSHSIEIRLIMN